MPIATRLTDWAPSGEAGPPPPQVVMDFDGVDDCVDFGNDNSLNKNWNDAFFVEATIVYTGTSTKVWFSKALSSGTFRGFLARVNLGRLSFQIRNSSPVGIEVETQGTWNNGQPRRVRIDYDGSGVAAGVTFTVDDVVRSKRAPGQDNLGGNDTTNSAPASVGSRQNDSFFFIGTIYDVNYNGQIITAGNGNQNSNWTDSSGNGFNGTVLGNPGTIPRP